MTGEEIKTECTELYETLKVVNKRLEELRGICAHEKTHKGLYSWRIGSFDMSLICDFCNECVKYGIDRHEDTGDGVSGL